jgi:hypothetical protein
MGTMPLSDSSEICGRAVRPYPFLACLLRGDLPPRRLRGLPVLVQEVPRRVWGLGLRRTAPVARANATGHAAFRANPRRRRPDCCFSELNSQPTSSLCLRFAEPLAVSCAKLRAERIATPFSWAFASSASCRFIPAHGFPHSHSDGGGDCSGCGSPHTASLKQQHPKVGQDKPPKWANRSCQTHSRFQPSRRCSPPHQISLHN